jgi:hypothetical protein
MEEKRKKNRMEVPALFLGGKAKQMVGPTNAL